MWGTAPRGRRTPHPAPGAEGIARQPGARQWFSAEGRGGAGQNAGQAALAWRCVRKRAAPAAAQFGSARGGMPTAALLCMKDSTLHMPRTMSTGNKRPPPSPVGQGVACTLTVPAPTGESPLKTPALRQFQIRGHRTGRPALRLIRHGGFSLVEASLRAHAPGPPGVQSVSTSSPTPPNRGGDRGGCDGPRQPLASSSPWTMRPRTHISRTSSLATATLATLAFLPALTSSL